MAEKLSSLSGIRHKERRQETLKFQIIQIRMTSYYPEPKYRMRISDGKCAYWVDCGASMGRDIRIGRLKSGDIISCQTDPDCKWDEEDSKIVVIERCSVVNSPKLLFVEFDMSVKGIFLGEPGVGKTSLLQHFFVGEKAQRTDSTQGVEHRYGVFDMNSRDVLFQLFDVGGRELAEGGHVDDEIRQYFERSIAAVFVYDISDRRSYDSISHWLDAFRETGKQDVCLMLIGNKCDLEKREVSTEEAAEFAQEKGMLFFETSAQTGTGVFSAMLSLVEEIAERQSAHVDS